MISETYKDIFNKIQSSGIALDIDDTLADTNLYWARQLLARFGAPDQYTAEHIISEYRYCRSVPFWGEKEKIFADKIKMSRRRILELPLVPHANEFVKAIAKRVPVVVYITSRSSKLADDTYSWLIKQGFPAAQVIAFPPNPGTLSEYQWKARVIEYLYPKVWGFVEDNVDVLLSLSPNYQGAFFLFANDKPEHAPIPFFLCENWKKIYINVSNEAKNRRMFE